MRAQRGMKIKLRLMCVSVSAFCRVSVASPLPPPCGFISLSLLRMLFIPSFFARTGFEAIGQRKVVWIFRVVPQNRNLVGGLTVLPARPGSKVAVYYRETEQELKQHHPPPIPERNDTSPTAKRQGTLSECIDISRGAVWADRP